MAVPVFQPAMDDNGNRAALADIRDVVSGYLDPAMDGLREAASSGDADAVRAHALEIVVVAGSVVAACPRPTPAAAAVVDGRRAGRFSRRRAC